MPKAAVINLTHHTIHLSTHEGDSLSVPPTTNGRSVKVDVKFIEWIPPNPAELRILHYILDNGQQVDKLPESGKNSNQPQQAAKGNKSSADNKPPPANEAKPAEQHQG